MRRNTLKNMIKMITLAAAAAYTLAAAPAQGQIVVPVGFAVDTLVDGQIDDVTPRIEAIRNPSFGSGVVAASIANNILTVRRISVGSIETIASTAASGAVIDVRFDTTGLFENDLYVLVCHGTNFDVTTMYRVTAGGTITPVFTHGSESNQLCFYAEFSSGANGYDPGAFLLDLNGSFGLSALWFLEPDLDLVELSPNSVPPGRDDIDVRGLEFDRTKSAAFGGRLLLAENDDNQTQIGGVYILEADGSWTAFSVNESTATRHLRDIAISPGGAFGEFAYMSEGHDDVIERLAPDGSVIDFASGFDFSEQYDNEAGGAASISVDDEGNALFVADDSGIYRIRPLGDDPGPVIICREPKSPSDVFCDVQGISEIRLIWSEPVQFTSTDVAIEDGDANDVGFSVAGSGTQFMLISLAAPLASDQYTVTVSDSVVSVATALPIDGDTDGTAGGDAVFTIAHQCTADFNGDGLVDTIDLLTLLGAWGTCN